MTMAASFHIHSNSLLTYHATRALKVDHMTSGAVKPKQGEVVPELN
jgi:hypothetical protein